MYVVKGAAGPSPPKPKHEIGDTSGMAAKRGMKMIGQIQENYMKHNQNGHKNPPNGSGNVTNINNNYNINVEENI